MAKGSPTLGKNENSWLYFFIDRNRLTILLAVMLFISGLSAFFTLRRELQPEVEIPTAYVMAIYPGASPEDTEKLVTQELEDKIDKIEEVDSYSSTTGSGYTNIRVEFVEGEDQSELMQTLREKVDEAKPFLPSDVDDPSVQEFSFSTIPILTLSLSGPYSPEVLRGYAEDIQDEIEKYPDVQDVFLTGAPEKRVEVVPDLVKLLGHNLTVSNLSDVIRMYHMNFPLGKTEMGNFEWSFRVEGRFDSIESIKNVPIKFLEETSQSLTVGDVANVQDGYTEQETYSRFSIEGSAPETTVALTITKGTGGDVIRMSRTMQEDIKELTKDFPADIRLEIVRDYAQFIEDDFKVLQDSSLQTIFLIFFVLMFFIGWKQALFAATTVPFAMFFGFVGMQTFGFTLNSLSLFSLILTLGILVDNGIIVQEGVHHYREQGVDPILAAKLSVRDYKWPLVAGTATTISAFLPMLITPGMIGQFIRVIPITVTIVLTGSLLAALIINTSLSAYLLGHQTKMHKLDLSKYVRKYIAPLYRKGLTQLLNHKWYRRGAYGVASILFVMALALPALGILQVEMFAGGDYDFFYIEMETKAGQSLDETDKLVKAVESELIKIPEIESFVSYTGSMAGGETTGDVVSDSPHLASISVNLFGDEKRKRTAATIVDELRIKTKQYENMGTIVYKTEEGGPPSLPPVYVRIFGPDFNGMEEVATKIKTTLDTIPYVTDIDDTVEIGKGQYTLRFDKNKLNQLGLNHMAISQTLRAMMSDSKVIEFWREGERQDVVITFDKKNPGLNDLLDLNFTTPRGERVALREIIDYDLEPEYTTIKHYNGDRTFSVSAFVEEGYTSNQAIEELEKRLENYEIPEGYSYTFGGEAEDIEESFMAMFRAFGYAILLIVMILVLQFDSFKQPFIIVCTIPLSLIGVLPGLTLLGFKLTFPAIIGVVALSGIVVNDAIVLIDRANSLIREHGANVRQALLEAGHSRLQPIMLTSVTTIAGVLPLAYSQPIWAPLSWSIACGLAATTFLTLFYVPMLYVTLEGKSDQKKAEVHKEVALYKEDDQSDKS